MSRLALAKRELGSLRREKTIVLAIAIQLVIAAFSSFLVVGLVALYSPSSTGGAVTVDVAVTGNATDSLVGVVDSDPGRRAAIYETREGALEDLRAGRVDAVLDATRHPAGNVTVAAFAPEGDFRTTLVVVQLKDALTTYERTLREDLSHRLERKPLDVPHEAGGNPYFGFTYTVLVPLLVLLPVFLSGSFAVDSITEEIERGTFELLRVAPLSAGQILDGKALATVVLAPAQAAAWLALLTLNGTPVVHPLAILVLSTALTVFAVATGALVALALDDRRSAQLLYSLGLLAAVGVASLAPANPVGAIAKLAIGSATVATAGVVVGTCAVAVVAYAAARRAAPALVARD